MTNSAKNCVTISKIGKNLLYITELRGFSNPRGICKHDNYLLVADTQNNRVQIFKSN